MRIRFRACAEDENYGEQCQIEAAPWNYFVRIPQHATLRVEGLFE